MKLTNLITFKQFNKIIKQDEANKLNVKLEREGSLEHVDVFTWVDCMNNKAYAVAAYKYGFGSYWSEDFDTLDEALNHAIDIIETKFTNIEKRIGSVSYINDSRKRSLALEILY